MERHDTHILSDSQEDDEKEENDHFYIFNNSKIPIVILWKTQSNQIQKEEVNLI